MALSFDIGANERAAVSSVKNLGKALEATSDKMDDVARDGDKSLGKLEKSFQQLADDAKDTSRVIKSDIPDAYRKAGDAADNFQRDATGNIQNFKSEAVQNFSEVASSFDGSVSSMADGVQGLTGGLASALTPGIGIPVAILGAAAAAFFANWVKSAEDSEERIAEMYDRLNEYGAAYISKANIAEALGDLSGDKVAEGVKRATDLQINAGVVLNAMVGDTEAISAIYSEMADRKQKEVDAIKEAGGSTEEQTTKIEAANVKYAEQTDWLRQIQGDTDTAASKWAAVQTAIGLANDGISSLGGSIRNLPEAVIKVRVDRSEWDNWRPNPKTGVVMSQIARNLNQVG